MMGNLPAPREIPPGKVLIAEYGEKDAPRAVVELLSEAAPRADFPGRRSIRGPTIFLVWSSPGFQPAGSCMTWTNGFYGVRWFEQNGTRHGRQYAPDAEGEAKARDHFRRLTDPQTPV